MAVIDVIRKRTRTMLLQRPAAATIVDGIAQPGTPVTSTIQAHVQVLSPQEVRDLPPGQNAIDWRNIWSESPLQYNDQIIDGGETFTIKRTEFWPEGPFYHGQMVIVRDQI